MTFFHGHSPATGTDIFHSCQFILAHMGWINLRGATETALGLISTGIAQMPRFIRYRTTVLAGICHNSSPFYHGAIHIQAKRGKFITK
jgi:hypothetical protein